MEWLPASMIQVVLFRNDSGVGYGSPLSDSSLDKPCGSVPSVVQHVEMLDGVDTATSTMNWTGGRLRRHSAIHARSRKQRLKKQTSKTGVAGESALLDRPAVLAGRSPVQLMSRLHKRSREVSPAPAIESHHRSSINKADSQPRQRLDRIRRELLKKPDWAAVAAARPIQIAFPTPESLARFGKRRKITEGDRLRLGTSGSCSTRVTRQRKREGSPIEAVDFSQINLKINGKRVVKRGTSSVHDQPTNASSQSMLLDRDRSVSTNHHRFVDSHRSFDDSDVFQDSSLLLENSKPSMSLQLSTPHFDSFSQAASVISSRVKRDLLQPDDMQQYSSGLDSRRAGSIISNRRRKQDFQLKSTPDFSSRSTSLGQELLVPRRFTIDDQIEAERKGRLALPLTHRPSTPQDETENGSSTRAYSLLSLGPESCSFGRASAVVPNLDESAWLPEPQRPGHGTHRTSSTVFTPQTKPTTSARGRHDTPLTLFGQTVTLDQVVQHRPGQAPICGSVNLAEGIAYRSPNAVMSKSYLAPEVTRSSTHLNFTNVRSDPHFVVDSTQSTLPWRATAPSRHRQPIHTTGSIL
ncbi:uncharacterized protein BP01DRAFT_363061 [Aspergillus saccharolyticus JOP 1030-1]|uniref:Uncharacterized protein n=1 Tax=Aspergillus saccharolyticus JOP 1030-1 TaxID=1450539 RepID=A0A319AQA6_9EURO|nr:hypothetical protein BP01DRAFT_363061 [Aspergillus saccharolyticus JOP 1030-1]PYH48592.1 hypothetical protein BP01DRAFT_363061 [Aspergillus saccharolyticus JOP 1030-1]